MIEKCPITLENFRPKIIWKQKGINFQLIRKIQSSKIAHFSQRCQGNYGLIMTDTIPQSIQTKRCTSKSLKVNKCSCLLDLASILFHTGVHALKITWVLKWKFSQ